MAGLLCVALTISVLVGAHGALAQENWSEVVAAARKEGEVIVWTQAGDDRRKFLKDAFEKDNPGITVRLFQAASSSQRDSRYIQERTAGIFKADVFVGGGASATARLLPENLLRPMKPLLRAETLDPKKWLTKEAPWMDLAKERIIVSDVLAYPTATVHKSVTDLTSFEQLLDPKYDGKIVMPDPRKSGSGFSFTIFMYHEPTLGEAYIKQFFARNRIVFVQDDRQNAEWVDSGRALVGINIRPAEIEALQKVGGTLRIVGDLTFKGEKVGSTLGSDGAIFVPAIDPLPNPNAARVYLNWFLSKPGQQALVDIIGVGSHHAEVDQSRLSTWTKPRPGVRYLNLMTEPINTEAAVNKMRKIVNDAIDGK
jgi:iron(III) transport system substrate-binding protein